MEDGFHHDDLNARCAGCVSRRAFLGQAALAAATAALLAACGDGQIGGSGPTGPVTAVTVKVSDFADLATVDKLTNINAQISAKRVGTATFAAFSRRCTHEGTTVVLFGSGFFCPNHGSQFDNNGHVTVGPAPKDLPALTASHDATTDLLSIG
jgi:cytochrome b6-f complex iron-sulfur subunit